MFDLQASLEKRLSILKGESKPVRVSKSKKINAMDVSKESIKKSLIQAGILDESGKLKEIKIG